MSKLRIVCPFCPLHCDDLLVDPAGKTNANCAIAESRFLLAIGKWSKARIGDQPASDEEIQNLETSIFASDKTIKVAASSAPLSISRWLSGLVRDGAIELSIDQTPTMSAMRATIARDGYISATLGDVKKHADTVWSIGNPTTQMPRIWERLGCDPVSRESISANGLADFIFAMRADTSEGLQESDRHFSRLSSAAYLAILVGPDAFLCGEELVTAELLVNWVLDQNRPAQSGSRRVVILAIDPAATLRGVVGWQTNRALSITNQEVDLRVGEATHASHRARLQIGGTDPGIELAHAYRPALTPGIDFGDAVIRGDGTVTLPIG